MKVKLDYLFIKKILTRTMVELLLPTLSTSKIGIQILIHAEQKAPTPPPKNPKNEDGVWVVGLWAFLPPP